MYLNELYFIGKPITLKSIYVINEKYCKHESMYFITGATYATTPGTYIKIHFSYKRKQLWYYLSLAYTNSAAGMNKMSAQKKRLVLCEEYWIC